MASTKPITESVQKYIPIKEIKEGTVILPDGSLRAVVGVSAMNFGLKSEPEKNSIIFAYQAFLNSLEFPIQILALSRKIDLSGYLEQVEGVASAETNPFIKLQIQEYRAFISALVESSSIMDKQFFVVVPYYPGVLQQSKKSSAEESKGFEQEKTNLLRRVETVAQGLTATGVKCTILNTEQLLELYYSVYNPDTSRNQKLLGIFDNMESKIISVKQSMEGSNGSV